MEVSYPPRTIFKKSVEDVIIYIAKMVCGNGVFMKKLSKILCVVLALLTVAVASSANASISDAITGVGGLKKIK
jgi:hypothetical protein